MNPAIILVKKPGTTIARLAFATSSSISSDIFLLEIRSTGNAEFQGQAKMRMQELIDPAGIIVVVSRDMHIIRRICTRANYLYAGKLVADGDVETVVKD